MLRIFPWISQTCSSHWQVLELQDFRACTVAHAYFVSRWLKVSSRTKSYKLSSSSWDSEIRRAPKLCKHVAYLMATRVGVGGSCYGSTLWVSCGWQDRKLLAALAGIMSILPIGSSFVECGFLIPSSAHTWIYFGVQKSGVPLVGSWNPQECGTPQEGVTFPQNDDPIWKYGMIQQSSQ